MFRPMQGHLRQSWILYSTLWIPDFREWIPDFVIGTWIPDFNRYWGPYSFSGIPDSKGQNSGFQMQTFPVFRNPLHGAIGTVIVLTMCEKIPCSSGTLNTCNLSRAIYKFKSLTHCICTPRRVTLDTNSFEDEDDHEGKIWLRDFFAYSQK